MTPSFCCALWMGYSVVGGFRLKVWISLKIILEDGNFRNVQTSTILLYWVSSPQYERPLTGKNRKSSIDSSESQAIWFLGTIDRSIDCTLSTFVLISCVEISIFVNLGEVIALYFYFAKSWKLRLFFVRTTRLLCFRKDNAGRKP